MVNIYDTHLLPVDLQKFERSGIPVTGYTAIRRGIDPDVEVAIAPFRTGRLLTDICIHCG
jgi:hypothetical protein